MNINKEIDEITIFTNELKNNPNSKKSQEVRKDIEENLELRKCIGRECDIKDSYLRHTMKEIQYQPDNDFSDGWAATSIAVVPVTDEDDNCIMFISNSE